MPVFPMLNLNGKATHLADAFFKEWLSYSAIVLGRLAPNCPLKTHKTRPWFDGIGPKGLIYHYTGGPDGIASLRWGNENKANTGSSWHVTCLDHELREVAKLKKDFPLVAQYLPVTAILHADVNKSTWHGNWTNANCFGIENRNLGRLSGKEGSYYRAAGSRRYPVTGERVSHHNEIPWESYTAGQLIANINIARMLYRWRGCKFDPTWVLPHSAVCWTKSDTGLAFPINQVRDAIFSPIEPELLTWIHYYPAAKKIQHVVTALDEPTLNQLRDENLIVIDDRRESGEWDKIVGTGWRDYLPFVRESLDRLGYHVDALEAGEDPKELEPTLQAAVEIFQVSTRYRKGHSALKPDGIPGDGTLTSIKARLQNFGFTW